MKTIPAISRRLDELLNESEALQRVQGKEDTTARLFALHTSTSNLISILVTSEALRTELLDKIRITSYIDAARFIGVINALKTDYEQGLLRNISEMVEANVAADYMGLANQLLDESVRGQFDHVPAAVLAGAVLEDSLRRICQRQIPPIATEKPNGDHKMLNALIDDLKAANVFHEVKAKQLRAWVDIRNAAAHGRFTEFSRQDVEQMLKGIESFLADHL